MDNDIKWAIVSSTSVLVSIILLIYVVGQNDLIEEQQYLLDTGLYCNSDTDRMLLNSCDIYYKELVADYRICKATLSNVSNNHQPIITEISSTIYRCDGK